jgi:ferredoxin
MNTLGSFSGLWKELVDLLQNKCKLIVDLSFNPYVFPNRTITFKQNKKVICKFIINVDRLHIRLPLSYEIAKELILKRKSLPQSINNNINEFHCVGCRKCEDSRNIEIIEGVPLCNLHYSNFVTEDSRCLRFTNKRHFQCY